MIFHDITRDICTTEPYGDDPQTAIAKISSIANGDAYDLSHMTCCLHTGTHIDAPSHYLLNKPNVNDIDISVFYGECTVVAVKGILTGEHMDRLLPYCKKRILFHGDGETFLSSSAAQVLADNGVLLVGTDAPSIGADYEDDRVHTTLLRNNIAILENVDLEGIKDGVYVLSAFPMKINEAEAAPCRAVLIEGEKMFWF